MKKITYLFIFATIFLLMELINSAAFACTDFQTKTTDGAIIIGRSMEFAVPVRSKIKIIQQRTKQKGEAPNGKDGFIWTNKYGYVGINAFDIEDAIIDGMNEVGLSVEGLWLPGTGYQNVAKKEMNKAINVKHLCSWILGNFKTVEEVKNAITKLRIWGSVIPEINMIPPLHFAVHDASGKNIVIEYIKGEVNIYDNPIGVMTNAPTFDWHLTNLRNYVNLTAQNAAPLTIEGINLRPTGHGSGMLGIPGNWTPPSRFVRAVMFVHSADTVKNDLDGVILTSHILNTVDIPQGSIKQKKSNAFLKDYTQWAVIKNLTQKILYVRDYNNLALRAIDLKKLNFEQNSKTKSIAIENEDYKIIDITNELIH